MYDVVTVGSATLDAFAKTRFSELIKIIDTKGETDLLAFPSGSKILIDELEFTVGGGGTNTAVALARLGHKVAFLGKLGTGANSDFILESLKKEKIGLLCAAGRQNCGYSLILDTLEHDRTVLTYKGANDYLLHKDVPYKKLDSKWFYFSSMLGESFKTLEKLAEFAKKRGIKVAFNPSSYLAEKGASYLKSLLSKTEMLVLNKEEARLLAGNEGNENLLLRIRELGPRIVAITDGRNDVCAIRGAHIYRAKPPFVKVVDTTGAGDAFASSFLSGIIRKDDMEFAIKLGIANSLSVINHYGAKNVLLSFNEAIKSIKRLKIRVHKKKI